MMNKDKQYFTNQDRLTIARQGAWGDYHIEKGWTGELKGIDEILIVFQLSGKALVSVGKSEARVITGKKMFLLPPHDLVYFKAEEDTHSMACLFDMEMLFSLEFSMEQATGNRTEYKGGFKELPIKDVLHKFLMLVEDYIYYKEFGVSVLNLMITKERELLYLLLASYSPEELDGLLFSVAGENMQFMQFVFSNFLKAKNVHDLAYMSNYSTSGFIKRFVRCFHESPYRWMSRKKAEFIRFDINAGELTLTDIADKYHFSSYQHFSDFCKTQLGNSPKKLISKKIRSGELAGRSQLI